jgi:quercetin dioxygenase-like cupin family protein
MISRREMNKAMSVAFASLLSGASRKVLAAEAAPAQQDSQGQAAPQPRGAPKPLIEEPLEALPESTGRMLILDIPPHSPTSTRKFAAHEHPGPVFAYILEGNIENQVEPEAPKKYAAGDVFYEPTMHVHRMLRNLSDTQPAKVLVFQIVPNGKPDGIMVK